MNYSIDYIGCVQIDSDRIQVFFKMEDIDIPEKMISVALELLVSSDSWKIDLLSHEFEGECPVCGSSEENCVLDESRMNLLMDYLLDYLNERIPEFKKELRQLLK